MTEQPAMIGRYQIRQKLGSGGFATVYRAYDPALEREVALKVLHPHLAGAPAIRERFIREGRALARVKHPNVVAVFEAGELGEVAFLATDLVEGRPLDEILAERGPLPLADVTRIVEQIGGALAAVHARGLVHRDVKPANIMIEAESGRAVLLDLGVARDLANVTSTSGAIIGTPGFMAPEQVNPTIGEVTAQTDVYQLGATAFALLTGASPFTGDTAQMLFAIVHRGPPDIAALRPDMPPGVAAALAKSLLKGPQYRPAGTLAFAEALRVAVEGGPARPAEDPTRERPAPPVNTATIAPGMVALPLPAPVTGAPPAAPGGRRWWRYGAGAVAGLLAIALLVGLLLRDRRDTDAGSLATPTAIFAAGPARTPTIAATTPAPTAAPTAAPQSPAATARPAPTPSTAPAATRTPAPAATPVPTPAPSSAPAANPAPPTAPGSNPGEAMVGQQATSCGSGGRFALMVTRTDWQRTLVTKTPQGNAMWLVVFLNATNLTTKRENINYTVKLRDDRNRIFPVLSDLDSELAKLYKTNPPSTSILPGVTENLFILFAVAPDAKGLALIPEDDPCTVS